VELLNHNPSIIYFRHLAMAAQEVDLVLEEDFLDLITNLVRDLPVQVRERRDPRPAARPPRWTHHRQAFPREAVVRLGLVVEPHSGARSGNLRFRARVSCCGWTLRLVAVRGVAWGGPCSS
jgi:hypothetical protein